MIVRIEDGAGKHVEKQDKTSSSSLNSLDIHSSKKDIKVGRGEGYYQALERSLPGLSAGELSKLASEARNANGKRVLKEGEHFQINMASAHSKAESKAENHRSNKTEHDDGKSELLKTSRTKAENQTHKLPSLQIDEEKPVGCDLQKKPAPTKNEQQNVKAETHEERIARLQRERNEIVAKKIEQNVEQAGKQISKTVKETGKQISENAEAARKHITENTEAARKHITESVGSTCKQISKTADEAQKQVSETTKSAARWIVNTKQSIERDVQAKAKSIEKQLGLDEINEANQRIAKEKEKAVQDDLKKAQEGWNQATKGLSKTVSEALDAVGHVFKF